MMMALLMKDGDDGLNLTCFVYTLRPRLDLSPGQRETATVSGAENSLNCYIEEIVPLKINLKIATTTTVQVVCVDTCFVFGGIFFLVYLLYLLYPFCDQYNSTIVAL